MTMRAQALPRGRIIDDLDFQTLLHMERQRLAVEGQRPAVSLEEQKARPTINKRGGRSRLSFDLGDARFTTPGYIEVPTNGWGIVYSVQGSAPGGALDLDFDLGGVEENVQPGAILRAPFDRFVVRRNAGSVTSGTAVLRVQREPDVTYDELSKGGGAGAGTLGNPSGGGIGPAGATTQAYNSAAGNIPTAATDGLSLTGVSGVRAIVKSNAATTIVAGELHWWEYSTADAAWGETDMADIYALSPNRNIWVPLDKEIWVPEGRIYAELRSYTNSGGSGAATVRLQTWGS